MYLKNVLYRLRSLYLYSFVHMLDPLPYPYFSGCRYIKSDISINPVCGSTFFQRVASTSIFLGGLSMRSSSSRDVISCSTHFIDSSRRTLAAIYGRKSTVDKIYTPIFSFFRKRVVNISI